MADVHGSPRQRGCASCRGEGVDACPHCNPPRCTCMTVGARQRGDVEHAKGCAFRFGIELAQTAQNVIDSEEANDAA